jgi:hypothetical protein
MKRAINAIYVIKLTVNSLRFNLLPINNYKQYLKTRFGGLFHRDLFIFKWIQ